jgi:hypothetical protein
VGRTIKSLEHVTDRDRVVTFRRLQRIIGRSPGKVIEELPLLKARYRQVQSKEQFREVFKPDAARLGLVQSVQPLCQVDVVALDKRCGALDHFFAVCCERLIFFKLELRVTFLESRFTVQRVYDFAHGQAEVKVGNQWLAKCSLIELLLVWRPTQWHFVLHEGSWVLHECGELALLNLERVGIANQHDEEKSVKPSQRCFERAGLGKFA